MLTIPLPLAGMQPGSVLDILVVDDDGPLRDMLSRSFEREGHRGTAVADGHAALSAAAEDGDRLVVVAGEAPRGVGGARFIDEGHGATMPPRARE